MLKILKSGFYTTIQDRGRFGYRDMGVPVAGAMDSIAASKANGLLENSENHAVMEITMTGPVLRFEKETYIVLSGAAMSARLNNEPLERYKVYKINAGDDLVYGHLQNGFRSYLAIKNGFTTEKVLGSRSFSNEVTPIVHLKDLSEVSYESCDDFEPKIPKLSIAPYFDDTVIEVDKGPEFEMLNDRQLEMIFSTEFTVSKKNNRMAYQLKETIPGHSFSILTSATLPGTVQFTPAGKLIVLMRDGQTTGGYPRILQFTKKAISVLAQKKSEDVVSFKLVANTL